MMHAGNNLLITGSGGLLGRRICECYSGDIQLTLHHHHAPDKKYDSNIIIGDLSDEKHIKEIASNIRPDIIINCAALADVDKCETEPELSKNINVDAVRLMLSYFPSAKFIHISTDYLFSGSQPAGPDDKPDPLNIYGRHKMEAEKLTLEASPNNLIIRTNTMYDYGKKRNYFHFVYDNLINDNPICGAGDQTSNPISALSAARLIKLLIDKNAVGIFHIGGSEFVTRYELARRIAERFDCDPSMITLVDSVDLSRKANRPDIAGLNCIETEKFLKIKMPSIDDDLMELRKLVNRDGDKF